MLNIIKILLPKISEIKSNILNIPTSVKDNFHIKTAREIMSYSFFFNKIPIEREYKAITEKITA